MKIFLGHGGGIIRVGKERPIFFEEKKRLPVPFLLVTDFIFCINRAIFVSRDQGHRGKKGQGLFVSPESEVAAGTLDHDRPGHGSHLPLEKIHDDPFALPRLDSGLPFFPGPDAKPQRAEDENGDDAEKGERDEKLEKGEAPASWVFITCHGAF